MTQRTMQIPVLREGVSRAMLQELLSRIRPLPLDAAAVPERHWRSLCKPLGSLGMLEDLWTRITAISGTQDLQLDRGLSVVFGADNGIVSEGVTQCGPEVTAQVLRNMAGRKATVAIFDECLGWDRLVVNLGTVDSTDDCPGVEERCVRPGGTGNFLKEAAMSETEGLRALLFGFDLALAAKKAGFEVLAGGEMGIGNTSSSTCLGAMLLGREPAELTGRGAGLSEAGLKRKKDILTRAAQRAASAAGDPLTLLYEVGGLDIAALCGLYLGAAFARLPVLLDGVISYAAAMTAFRLCPAARACWIPTHKPAETCGAALLEALGFRPALDLRLALGEGAGALLLVPLLKMSRKAYLELPSFEKGEVEAYEDFSRSKA